MNAITEINDGDDRGWFSGSVAGALFCGWRGVAWRGVACGWSVVCGLEMIVEFDYMHTRRPVCFCAAAVLPVRIVLRLVCR